VTLEVASNPAILNGEHHKGVIGGVPILSSSHGFWSVLLPRTISACGIAILLGVLLLTAAALQSHQWAIGAAQAKELFHCHTLLFLTCPSTQEMAS
jgi:hypothetical protein